MNEWTYLGDGVYAKFDGFMILLRRDSHENEESEIAIEYEVFQALAKLAERSFK